MSRYKHLISQLAMPILVAAAAGAIAAILIGGSWPKTLLDKAKALPAAVGKRISSTFGTSGTSGTSGTLDSGGYAAVYLTGGKVYFGILGKADSTEPILKDVFYLTLGGGQNEFQLKKLTGQDNPSNELVLSRDHILYWEPLEPDSKVVQGIEEFHKQQSQ